MPVKSCKWCKIEKDVEAFPLRSAACGPCKSHWESIWRSMTSIYIKEGYQWFRQSQLQLYVFNDYKNFVEAGGRGHDFKWCDFIPEFYLKSNEEHPVDAPVAPEPPVPAVPAPGAASASGEVVSPELVVQHHHDAVRARGMPVKSCKWCFRVHDVEAFPLRSAACGPCKSHWESIWRSMTRIYIKEGYQWLRESQVQLYVFNDYKDFVEAGGRGRDFKWGDFIPELYLKSNEEHPVDAPVAPVPAVPAPGAASASGEVVSPELVVQHHHDDDGDECVEIVSGIRRVRRRSM